MNPWKGWYQPEQPPADALGSDATQDMTFSSRMPPPAERRAGRRSWPDQPPPSSGGGASGSPYGGAGYQGGSAYQGGTGYQGGSGYGGGASYGASTYGGAPTRGGGRRWRFWGQPGRRGRRIALILCIVVVVIIAGTGGTYFWINGKLNRTVALPAFTGTSAGTNWLIVGDDSRNGISRAQQDALHLGTQGADASDSLMLLHMGTGKPVLISIPRDSYVPIPGHGDEQDQRRARLRRADAARPDRRAGHRPAHRPLHGDRLRGPGRRREHGRRRADLPAKTAIQPTPDSGVNLKAGCQNLSGTQAIAFVRDRHSFATSDLQRIQDQRAFLSALLSKATSPSVYLNPFTALPFASTSASSIAVDKGASLYDLLQAAFALRGPETGTVPIANANYETSAGDAVLWDQTQALELFNALKAGKAVPAGLLSGTKVG